VKNQLITLSTRQDVYRKIDVFMGKSPQKKYRVTLVEVGKKRSDAANRAYQGWYPAIADELALTITEATRYIKLEFGLPILFSGGLMGDIINKELNVAGFFQLSYQDQLIQMTEMHVTRLFDTTMHNRLRDELQNVFGAMGLNLGYGE